MIRSVARGHVVFEFGGKTATIPGEALLPGHGSPDFVIYGDLFTSWDPPDDGVQISAKERELVLEALEREMRNEGYRVEIE